MSTRTPEGKVKDMVRDIFKKINAQWPGRLWHCMPMGQMYGKRGVPDFLVCVNGNFVAVEVKAQGGKLSAMQQLELNQIGIARGYTFVANPDNIELLSRMLHELVVFGTTGVQSYTNEAVR